MPALPDAALIDIHTHYRPRGWRTPVTGDRPLPAAVSEETFADLTGLARESAAAGVELRALSAPVEQLFGLSADVPTTAVNQANEYLAGAVREHPGQFIGLATVDGYAGDAGAEQTRYAIEQLGLQGIVLDSSRHDRYLSSLEAFPTLEAAAGLAVPVFVHPVNTSRATTLVQAAGRPGNAIGRGLENGVSFLSALHANLPARLPDLHLIFTALGNGALYFVSDQLAVYRETYGDDAPRLNIYFDTTRFSPPLLRYFGQVLGADRIVVGSDWPLHHIESRTDVEAALTEAGFDAAERELISAGNARRLFGLRTARDAAAVRSAAAAGPA
jgi:predicted TIM-barrel fold metal-dependent hydrolase